MAQKLNEQVAHRYPQETSDQSGVFIQHRRASLPHTQAHASRPVQPYDDEDDDAMYTQKPPSSARRYLPLREEVYTQGNKKIVVHHGAPKGRRFHWMIFMGMAMFAMVFGWLLLTALGYWLQQKQDDWKYGAPFRTFQVDQYVAMGDSPQNPDHFLALDIHGSIEIVQLNTQNPPLDHVYPITTVTDSSTPVFLSFEDTRHMGKLDMLVTIGDSNPYTVVLLNNGTQFTK